MAQVAARIGTALEKQLKAMFRTKSAGAEFILPWAMETFGRVLAQLKTEFSASELKTIVEAYKKVSRLLPEQCRQSYFLLRMREACSDEGVHLLHGASWPSLERKLERLDDTRAAAFMIWAVAHWTSPVWDGVGLDVYVRP